MKGIILDIESRNHLEKDCNGDASKLQIGLIGIKELGTENYLFFDDTDIETVGKILKKAEIIIGFNLVGHNGIDYRMLQNYGLPISKYKAKTFDLMTLLIRAFGSFEGLSLANVAEHTFGLLKKKSKKANYKLLQAGQREVVEQELRRELEIIEQLFLCVVQGGEVRFKTPSGIIDSHMLPPLEGLNPEYGEEIIEPHIFPFAGMQLQIKDRTDVIFPCKKCRKNWRVKSVCYYGDTSSEEVHCPNCKEFLTEVRCSSFDFPKIEETKRGEKNKVQGN